MTNPNKFSPFSFSIPALLLALGLIGAGFILGQSINAFKAHDRFVSVKGLAEQEFPADRVIWPISFRVADNDLPALQQRMATATDQIITFVKAQNLGDAEIMQSPPRITDHYAYNTNPNDRPANRYSAEAVVTIRTNKTKAVKKAMQATGSLLAKGVMVSHSYEYQPRFEFTRLNEVKPQMIATATSNARDAARRFAQDSGSKVGTIRSARQGLFSIRPRDQYTPEIKVVRVVTSVDFFLKD